MTNYTWKFTMGTKKEPTWEVRNSNKTLIAYAKRAKDAGWFARISGLNDETESQKIYIGDDVFPPDFMKMMLEMNKRGNN